MVSARRCTRARRSRSPLAMRTRVARRDVTEHRRVAAGAHDRCVEADAAGIDDRRRGRPWSPTGAAWRRVARAAAPDSVACYLAALMSRGEPATCDGRLAPRPPRAHHRRSDVDSPAREARRCALPGRLRRTADRPPADGDPGADGQGRRLGARSTPTAAPTSRSTGCRRPARSARARPTTARSSGPSTGKADDTLRILIEEVLHDSSPRPRRRPRPAEGRRREAPPGAARRAPRDPRRGPHAGPPRVPDRDRPGRPDVPRRRRR